jgi:hypothetical protein
VYAVDTELKSVVSDAVRATSVAVVSSIVYKPILASVRPDAAVVPETIVIDDTVIVAEGVKKVQ